MSRSRKHRSPDRPSTPAVSPAAAWPWLWLLLGLLTLGSYAVFYFNPGLFWWFGVQHYDVWFADTYALLASGDAVTQGLNPYAPNPLDVFSRPHVYSHWWLHLRQLGLTRPDIAWLGPLIVILFVLAALRWLRPRSGWQLGGYFVLLISPPVLLALDRANNDLIIFLLLTPLVPCLRSARPWVRFLAPLLVAAAAGLKYYPAAAGLTLLAAAPPRELRIRLGLAVGLLVLAGVSVAPDLASFGPLAPRPAGWLTFGASSAFTQLGWTGAVPAGVCLAGAAGLFAWGWRSPRLAGWSPRPDQQGDWLRFVLGAALLSGCFFLSANFAYRWVFALWLAPLLWSLGTDATGPAPARRLARVTGGLLIAALWLDTGFTWILIGSRGQAAPDTLRLWAKWAFIAEQPLTWALYACLLCFLAHFTKDGLRRLVSSQTGPPPA